MKHILAGSLVGAVAAFLAGGCGSGEGGAELEKRCASACVPPSNVTPCQEGDLAKTCEDACLAVATGESDACAQCLVDHIDWKWVVCTCSTPTFCEREDSTGFAGGGDGVLCDQPDDNTCKPVVPALTDDICQRACAS
jgi:hypothetical protein